MAGGLGNEPCHNQYMNKLREMKCDWKGTGRPARDVERRIGVCGHSHTQIGLIRILNYVVPGQPNLIRPKDVVSSDQTNYPSNIYSYVLFDFILCRPQNKCSNKQHMPFQYTVIRYNVNWIGLNITSISHAYIFTQVMKLQTCFENLLG